MVVDDHPVVRAGIAASLALEPDLAIRAEAGSEQEALNMLVPCPPDLAIIDLSLTNSSGFSLFRELLNRYPKLRILVLSMHDEFVNDRLRTVLLKGLATGAASRETPEKVTRLSKSELIVLQLIGLGHTNREIATSLHQDGQPHCANLQRKLGLSSRHALRQYALQWVQPPPPT